MTKEIPKTNHEPRCIPTPGVFRHSSFIIHLLLAVLGLIPAFSQEAFTPPQAYPMERYEAGWNKNPFTLKTAPVALKTESFAKDLVLASMYRVGGETTVVVANKQTRERTTLKGTQPSGNGMMVKDAVISKTRKESYAEIMMNGASAVLHYDDSFTKQMAAAGVQAAQKNAAAAAANAGLTPEQLAMNRAAQRPPMNLTAAPAQPQGSAETGAPLPVGAGQPTGLSSPAATTGGPIVPTIGRRRLNTVPISRPPTAPPTPAP